MLISTENERNGGRMSVRRKFANLLEYFNPFSTKTMPQQDEDIPAAKKPRLETSTSSSKAVDNAADDTDSVVDARTYRYVAEDTLTASPDDDTVAVAVAVAPSDAVTVVASSLPRAEASRARSLQRKWTVEEDAKLTEAVKKYGYSWAQVTTRVPGRTYAQCRYRWITILEPTIDRSNARNIVKWTPEEDAKLTDAITKFGNSNWAAAAELVPGRTSKQCRSRWVTNLNPDVRKGRWTREEDAKLTDAVTKFGYNWIRVATLVPGRTNITCCQRWTGSLNPDIIKGKWTAVDDARLIVAVQELGNAWFLVAERVPGRTDTQCRSRWVTRLVFDIFYRGKWSLEEDSKLTEAVKEHGCSHWVKVAAMVPGRTDKQCRSRWVKSLDPDINAARWTAEEDAKLIVAVKELGNAWFLVAARVPGRTDAQCRRRWVWSLDPDRSTNEAEQEQNASEDEGRD
jgi:hypothetical protein